MSNICYIRYCILSRFDSKISCQYLVSASLEENLKTNTLLINIEEISEHSLFSVTGDEKWEHHSISDN